MRKIILKVRVGKKYGKLKVKATGFSKLTNTKMRRIRRFSICECACGNRIEVDNYNLVSGHSKSCGCNAGKRGKVKQYGKRALEIQRQKFHFPRLSLSLAG